MYMVEHVCDIYEKELRDTQEWKSAQNRAIFILHIDANCPYDVNREFIRNHWMALEILETQPIDMTINNSVRNTNKNDPIAIL